MSSVLELKNYSYKLPQDYIAQEPLLNRDEARLMVIDRRSQKIYHDKFYNIGRYLPQKSIIVCNNSKVMPARLLGKKVRTGGKVEIFVLKKLGGPFFEVLMRPTRKIKEGDVVKFNGSSVLAHVVDRQKKIVRFNRRDILKHIDRIGHIPLPPYIKRQDTKLDRKFYQTVYARHTGSVAAPTAGLHFTKTLIKDLKGKGHQFTNVTLHINYATFKPVEEDNIVEHKMHTENYSVSKSVANSIKGFKKRGQKIVSVGTTSCRVLETVANTGKLNADTDLFIYPGYKFKYVDVLITNFHLPYSTLLMLVYAFGGMRLIKRAYKEAIKKKYRFYSYGDAMVIK